MRPTNPLSDILESTLRLQEPVQDTDWPAGDVVLPSRAPVREARIEDLLLRSYNQSRN